MGNVMLYTSQEYKWREGDTMYKTIKLYTSAVQRKQNIQIKIIKNQLILLCYIFSTGAREEK